MSSYDEQNVFAKILRSEIPSYRVYEDENCLAFLDAFPVVMGHTILIPKTKCINILDTPEDVASKVLSKLPIIAEAVKKATGATGINIISNAGSDAGQAVFHTHFHIIPRFSEDNLLAFPKSIGMINSEEANHIQELIKSNLNV
ncbi:HIT domain-containing protein [Cryptosporidium andersoni]|uniref:HIT domain-containing protein n=1 Tax=Cryptosporidium andersoni TaxID=117008 RepID=A0A1J4M9X3_9CRYT|nr:HIT domain-containing protein [Cryptosporidium andersoni]